MSCRFSVDAFVQVYYKHSCCIEYVLTSDVGSCVEIVVAILNVGFVH